MTGEPEIRVVTEKYVQMSHLRELRLRYLAQDVDEIYSKIDDVLASVDEFIKIHGEDEKIKEVKDRLEMAAGDVAEATEQFEGVSK